MSNEGSIKASVWLILLKCIVVSCSNGNKCFTGRLFPSYGPLNMLFHFLSISHLYYSVFQETFVKMFMKLSFFSPNFKNPFQDIVCYRKLGCLTLWYWNGCPLNISFWSCFFWNKKLLTFWIFMKKDFGNNFSFLIKWHIWVTVVEITGRRTWKQNWK